MDMWVHGDLRLHQQKIVVRSVAFLGICLSTPISLATCKPTKLRASSADHHHQASLRPTDTAAAAAAAEVSLFAVSHLSSCEVFPLEAAAAVAPDYYPRVLCRFALPIARSLVLLFKLLPPSFFFLSLFLSLSLSHSYLTLLTIPLH